MNQYRLNPRSMENARALLRGNRFTNDAWSFTADSANALLGVKPGEPGAGNWNTYEAWMLGYASGKPDPAMDTGVTPDKSWFDYCFGDGQTMNLNALRGIIQEATADGAMDVAAAAKQLLMGALKAIVDQKSSGGPSDPVADLPVTRSGGPLSMPAAAADNDIIGILCDVDIKAAADTSKVPTFHMDAYSGGPMWLEGWTHPVIVDLDGLQVSQANPALRDHDMKKIAGHTTDVTKTPDHTLSASGVMSGVGHPHADEIVTTAKNGFPWQCSIGAKSLDTEFVPAGKSAKANGRTWPGPVNIARKSKLGEISFVARGADSGTSARIAAKAANKGPTTMFSIKKYDAPTIIAAAARRSGISEIQAYHGLTAQQKDKANDGQLIRECSSIFGLCNLIAQAHGVERLPENRISRAVLNVMQAIEGRALMNSGDPDIQADGGGAGGMSTLSLSGVLENILNKGLLDSYAMIESVVPMLCHETETNDFKIFKRYRLTASGIMQALGAAGEIKSISLQDETYPNQVGTQAVILNIDRETLYNDDLGAITQSGTLLGRGALLYREMIVIATYLGLKAIAATGASPFQRPNQFNFISALANNYLTGAGSALSDSAMTLAVQRFAEQTDANGMPIMLKAGSVLVPPALESTSDRLFRSAAMIVTGLASTSAASISPDANVHESKYATVMSPFLSHTVGQQLAKLRGPAVLANFANASDTAWALLPKPAQVAMGMAPLSVGYLSGQRTPIIEHGAVNFNQLGMSCRVIFDFGVSPLDWRTLIASDGQ